MQQKLNPRLFKNIVVQQNTIQRATAIQDSFSVYILFLKLLEILAFFSVHLQRELQEQPLKLYFQKHPKGVYKFHIVFY